MESEKESSEKPREEGHNYVHTVPDLPYKHDKEGEGQGKGERPRMLKQLTKQEFGLTWD
jgi:hypothetical protein